MPIDYSRYPANWLTEIRPRILERAGNKCEWCKAENYKPHPVTGGRVVLTIAHIHNPDPMDCRVENLAALCNKCHNKHDAPMRARNAMITRQKKEIANGQTVADLTEHVEFLSNPKTENISCASTEHRDADRVNDTSSQGKPGETHKTSKADCNRSCNREKI
jgi:hypothetical protein